MAWSDDLVDYLMKSRKGAIFMDVNGFFGCVTLLFLYEPFFDCLTC